MNTDRFKFRAWSKEKSKIYPLNIKALIAAEIFRTLIPNFENDKDLILMQCTGLKDSEGSLIYEGDIVKYEGKPYQVIWDKYGFNLKGFYQGFMDYPTEAFSEGLSFRVIGNIYENPELLEEKEIR